MVGLFILIAQAPKAFAQERVDVAIVLAVDTSASVDSREYQLQMQGIADSLNDPEIIATIQRGPNAAIAISLLQWSSIDEQAVTLDWMVLRTGTDTAIAARAIRRTPRLFGFRGTAIADAIDYANRHLERLPFRADRRVIDVSGDGKNMHPPLLLHAKRRAEAAGIVINGLPIISTDPNIHHYYADHVIAGPGSFIEIANSYDDFGVAMKRKLLREIRGIPMVSMAED
ncbi:DUF1194 domain-containing protein [Minwuia sp.]|uniref:DUF1194 domain-containing protein n=1 Tax=Minwuia sp. TaxID=2493630 RepID=UPI003A8D8263